MVLPQGLISELLGSDEKNHASLQVLKEALQYENEEILERILSTKLTKPHLVEIVRVLNNCRSIQRTSLQSNKPVLAHAITQVLRRFFWKSEDEVNQIWNEMFPVSSQHNNQSHSFLMPRMSPMISSSSSSSVSTSDNANLSSEQHIQRYLQSKLLLQQQNKKAKIDHMIKSPAQQQQQQQKYLKPPISSTNNIMQSLHANTLIETPESQMINDERAAMECQAKQLSDPDEECKAEMESAKDIFARCSATTKHRINTLITHWNFSLEDAVRGLRLNNGNVFKAAHWLVDYVSDREAARMMDMVAVESEQEASALGASKRAAEAYILMENENVDLLAAFKSSVILKQVPFIENLLTMKQERTEELRFSAIELLKIERSAIGWYNEVARAFARSRSEVLRTLAEAGCLSNRELEQEKALWAKAVFSLSEGHSGAPLVMLEAFENEKKKKNEINNDINNYSSIPTDTSSNSHIENPSSTTMENLEDVHLVATITPSNRSIDASNLIDLSF